MPTINTFGAASARAFGFFSSSNNYTPSLTYIASYTGGGGAFSSINQSVSIGAATSDRIVVVVINIDNTANSTISSITIGGTNANILTPSDTNGTRTSTVIAQAAVTTGTTATVTASVSGTPDYWGISVYTLKGYSSSTPVWTSSYFSSTTLVSTMSLNVTSKQTNSVGLFTATNDSDAEFTWSNASRDVSQTRQPTYSVARIDSFSSGSYTVTATGSKSAAYGIMTGIIWY